MSDATVADRNAPSALRRLVRHKLALLGLVLILVVVAGAVLRGSRLCAGRTAVRRADARGRAAAA